MKKIIIALISLFLLCGCSAINGVIYDSSAELLSIKEEDKDATYTTTTNLVAVDNNDIYITEAGTYTLTGTLENTSVIINVDKDEEVQLVLDNVTINSNDFAAIYVVEADKVTITLADGSVNTLTDGSSYSQIDDNNVDAVIFSKADLVINGSGTLNITANYKHGIVSKDDLIITGGTYNINSKAQGICGKDCLKISDGTFNITSGTDGLKSNNDEDSERGYIYIEGGTFTINAADDGILGVSKVVIDGGTFNITAHEGIEGTYIVINGGDITISASDDGVNAAQKVNTYTPTFEMNGGNLTIVMGQGDTDAIDSNGYIYINGGTINITAQFAFDYDIEAQFNGGTIIVNGEEITQITNQFENMGGFSNQGGFGGQGDFGPNGGGSNSIRPMPDGTSGASESNDSNMPQMPSGEDFDPSKFSGSGFPSRPDGTSGASEDDESNIPGRPGNSNGFPPGSGQFNSNNS